MTYNERIKILEALRDGKNLRCRSLTSKTGRWELVVPHSENDPPDYTYDPDFANYEFQVVETLDYAAKAYAWSRHTHELEEVELRHAFLAGAKWQEDNNDN